MSEKRPLAIGCHATRCAPTVASEQQRHAFTSVVSELPGIGGTCRSCGASDLIDWQRLHQRDIGDLAHTQVALRKELIRDNYWTLELPERVMRNAHQRTEAQHTASATGVLGRALIVNHYRERIQTPFAYGEKATIIHCAQHATGTCCRTCLETWLGIPRGHTLTRAELAYCTELVLAYVCEKLADPISTAA